MKSKSTLAKFVRDYNKLLEKYPEITVYSAVDPEDSPFAYHHVLDDKGNVIQYFRMNLRSNSSQLK